MLNSVSAIIGKATSYVHDPRKSHNISAQVVILTGPLREPLVPPSAANVESDGLKEFTLGHEAVSAHLRSDVDKLCAVVSSY